MSVQRTIRVELGDRGYPIWIGRNLLADASLWRPVLSGRHALLVSNDVVAPLYAESVCAGLDGLASAQVVLPDGEANKNLGSIQKIFSALGRLGATRDACLIALGGGVVGDMTGFAAACWMRGIDFVQMPTSLLAMVDASVGGKTGVNLEFGKNLVGAFHQPRAVLIDTDVLATLPDREYRTGLAEVVKHGAIGDSDFIARLEQQVDALNRRDHDALAELIEHACRFKAAIVARDETEQGQRALLNFGHTFAHALETETGYGQLLHGEAVAIGMCQAARLSARLGFADADAGARLARLLVALGLPTRPPAALDASALVSHMRLDKKNRGAHLRLILWRGLGQAFIADDVPAHVIHEVLAESS